MPKNTTQCLRPVLEPRLLDPEMSVPAIRPLCLLCSVRWGRRGEGEFICSYDLCYKQYLRVSAGWKITAGSNAYFVLQTNSDIKMPKKVGALRKRD